MSQVAVTITEKSGEKNTLTFKTFEFILRNNTQPSIPFKEGGNSIFYIFTGGDTYLNSSKTFSEVDVDIVTTDQHGEAKRLYSSNDVSCVLTTEGNLVCFTDNYTAT